MRQGKRLNPKKRGTETVILETELQKRIVGQEAAIQEIVSVYQTFLAGMAPPGRPIGNFLFLGPTGSGKTRTVEALAEIIFGSPNAVVKIDCAEFQLSHEISKLIGSPPGYLGHRETHPLFSQEVLNQFHTNEIKLSFVLFDEIEKANETLWNLLLGILDKATLTLGDNRRVNFERTMIFMTSNLGGSEMSQCLRPGLGFTTNPNIEDPKLKAKLERAGTEAARRRFSPEFTNRVDKIVTFQALGKAELWKILSIELACVQKRIFSLDEAKRFAFTVTREAREFILREGTDIRYGARFLKRSIDKELIQPLSNLLATNQAAFGDLIRIDFQGGEKLSFYKIGEGLSSDAMLRKERKEARISYQAIPQSRSATASAS
jgi:ATP-dependent Clp protease ATP-binding subunit ClpB